MTTYKDIQEILDELVDNRTFGAHGAFWRTLSRDQFVVFSVFGFPIVSVGNSANSNIIKALKGEAPFNGSPFNRMPSGMEPATEEQINTIAAWIDNGCPEVSVEPENKSINYSDEHHNSYWREFDNWAMYQATPETNAHIGMVMSTLYFSWHPFIKNPDAQNLATWQNTLSQNNSKASLEYLAKRQRATIEKYYKETDFSELVESYERFGNGTLPPDPLRPSDPEHKMNGKSMWNFWLCFVDGTIRTGVDDVNFWKKMARAILIGMTNDGVMRNRFPVMNYNTSNIDQAKTDILNIADDDVLDAIVSFVDSSGM